MKKEQLLHFSIDDVGKSLRYIYINMPDSIFDTYFLGTLRDWHKEYGLKVTLYCVCKIDSFSIFDLQEKYCKELSEAREWLKLGFHSSSFEPFIEDDYKENFKKFTMFCQKMNIQTTNILRLHSWNVSKEQSDDLYANGIKGIFYPNNDMFPYDENDIFQIENMKYIRTKVWYEKLININEEALYLGETFISAFTHEWCFLQERTKIEASIKVYLNAGYVFI